MTTKFFPAISILAASLLSVGCSALAWTPHVKSPALVSTNKAGQKLTFSGDAMSPGKVTENRVTTILPIHSGSVVTEDNRSPDNNTGKIQISLNGESVMQRTEETTITEGPKAFSPPTPPTPSQIAAGQGLKMFYYLGALFFAASLLLVYLGHIKAAMFAGTGAFLAPILGNLIASANALLILGILAAISATLFAAWYLMNHPQKVAELVGHLPAKTTDLVRQQLEVPPAN